MNESTLLLHLDDTPACAHRIDIAFDMARRFSAHVVGLSACGSLPLATWATPGLLGVDVIGPAIAHFNLLATRRADAFRARCLAERLTSFDTLRADDDDASALLRHAAACDLVVLGQADPSQAAAHRRAIEDVVLRSPRPVLVVPHAGRFETVGRQVLVAWDGGRESARALGDALPVLRRADRVHLLACETPIDVGATPARPGLEAARAWLQRHGIAASIEVSASAIDVGNTLISHAADGAFDLIVMGAYGHARWAERVLGGTTRTVLATMTVPVLMSR